MEGILKAGLVKVPVKVKLLIKNERRANYVKTKNIEHIRSLHAETKKNYTHTKIIISFHLGNKISKLNDAAQT